MAEVCLKHHNVHRVRELAPGASSARRGSPYRVCLLLRKPHLEGVGEWRLSPLAPESFCIANHLSASLAIIRYQADRGWMALDFDGRDCTKDYIIL